MQSPAPVVRNEVRETHFGLYSDAEVKAISACRLTSSVTYDGLGNALPGGLYDSRLGPRNQGELCVTCGLSGRDCPGHVGHIELEVPVYHPLLFLHMFQVLRASCAFCHGLRMSKARCRAFAIKLKLYEMNDVDAAQRLDDEIIPPAVFDDEEKTAAADLEATLTSYEERYTRFCRVVSSSKGYTDSALSESAKRGQRDTIVTFQKEAAAIRKCENCSAVSPAYRKDGYNKIFRKPLSARMKQQMASSKRKMRSALEIAAAANGSTMDQGSDDDVDDDGEDDDDDDDDDNEGGAGGGGKGSAPRKIKNRNLAKDADKEPDKVVAPSEVEAAIKALWVANTELMHFIWGRPFRTLRYTPSSVDGNDAALSGYQVFFLRSVLVPANRFRPEAHVGERATESPQNSALSSIIRLNDEMARLMRESRMAKEAAAAGKSKSEVSSDSDSDSGSGSESEVEDKAVAPTAVNDGTKTIMSLMMGTWIKLQDAVNCYMDSAKDPNPLAAGRSTGGIRQVLEKKEGMFRMNMMGKRVNFCCRSVISPDPYIGTNEIGIPKHFAMSLHYPEPVNAYNVKHLRALVEKGPDEYPGANFVEKPNGQLISLSQLPLQERVAKSRLLLNEPGYKVYRHLVNGDVVLMNRQPSLHKPSIMAHKARVLPHVKEQTLRMNYANCNAYNADFDGDEMNCHFLQSELARAEATYICNTDNQYIVPTSGNPLRGLIQDHVASGVKLTCKDTFLTRGQFQQLLYVAVSGLEGAEILAPRDGIRIPPPAVIKPVERWTGKQVISALMGALCPPPLPPLNLEGKTRTPPTALGQESNEHIILFRRGELLMGVMDKSSIGNASLGVVHAVYELYGADFAGKLLNAFGRLFTYHLQNAGHTCGIEDLTLTEKADAERRALLTRVSIEAEHGLANFLDNKEQTAASDLNLAFTGKQRKVYEAKLAALSAANRKDTKVRLDGVIQGVINRSASDVIKACLPNGLEQPFLRNNFSIMVLTGAKGSSVNQSQISCFLGQQALEGQRVPVMISGKSLPSFRPFDSSARAGGFVQDRFLTGVKPQEYYFHCMAGREGLVDTAVKTSRSGYLQRCLVKHLEELQVQYDYTVRDSKGNVVQFLYGEDGIDPMASNVLRGANAQMNFMAMNHEGFRYKYGIDADFADLGLEMFRGKELHDLHAKAEKAMAAAASRDVRQPLHRLAKHAVVQARRRKNALLPWSRGNMQQVWHTAQVIKIRFPEPALGSSSSGGGDSGKKRRKSEGKDEAGIESVDLRYLDGTVDKRVPLLLLTKSSLADATQLTDGNVTIPLVRLGLPDPVMSQVPLGSTVGAVSEKIQSLISSYVASNPDGSLVSDAEERLGSSSAACDKNLFEFLVHMKYMRSLASPGEPVGCVAAQSVGEPSTQMTLNTFHLAGHGGANVTLGIPRLREIIMTASRSLKTPTMLLPLLHGVEGMDRARQLARTLGRLTLSQLLSHAGGIEVGESFVPVSGGESQWGRKYRVKLYFEPIKAISDVFGLSFDDILRAVRKPFLSKLTSLIATEQKNANEERSAKLNLAGVETYQEPRGWGRKGGASGGGGGADDDDGAAATGKAADDASDSGDDEDEEEINEEDGMLASKIVGKKETAGYDSKSRRLVKADEGDDDDEDDDEDDDDDGEDEDIFSDGYIAKHGKYSNPDLGKGKGKGGEEDGEAEDGDEEQKVAVDSTSPLAKSSSSKKKDKRLDEDTMGVTGNERRATADFSFTFPATARRLLMLQLAEKAAAVVTVRATKGITAAHPMACDTNTHGFDGHAVLTEGVAFEEIFRLSDASGAGPLVDVNRIASNDIYAVLQTYGVEAARASIVNEIVGVFKVYGIDVNPRHLNLIADFMTRAGSFTAMNRQGMSETDSPFLQMSFETTCHFLTKAAIEGNSDVQHSPTSRIVLGSVPMVGTGSFDLRVPLAAIGTKA